MCEQSVQKENKEASPSCDEEEESKDDQEGEAANRSCDNDQNLTLISNVWIYRKKGK